MGYPPQRRIGMLWPFGKKQVAIEEMIIPDEWKIAQGSHDGEPIIVRLRTGARPIVGHPGFTHQVGIAVPLLAPNPGEMPTSEETCSLNELEDTLSAHFETRNLAVLVVVITTGRMREFVWYTSNPEQVKRTFETIKGTIPSYNPQMIIQSDPRWNIYKSFEC
jgi:hypothetical protein